jgi:hypothetical protein
MPHGRPGELVVSDPAAESYGGGTCGYAVFLNASTGADSSIPADRSTKLSTLSIDFRSVSTSE